MKNYKCLKLNVFENKKYKIIPVRSKDIIEIKNWRNKQIKVLRQKEILTNKKQKEYFNKIIFPSFDYNYPEQILFSFLLNDRLIGYGGLVHINWNDKRGEVSFLLDPLRIKNKVKYKKDFTVFLKFMKQIAYIELGFNRLFTETFDIRKYQIKILENNNFVFEGRMKKHVFIDNRYVDSLLHGNLKEYEKF